MRKPIYVYLILCLFMLGCAEVTPIQECVTDDPYGFFGGLWHGIVSPISFIGSLLSPDSIAVYAVNNNGGWYDLGFVLGAGILFRGYSSK